MAIATLIKVSSPATAANDLLQRWPVSKRVNSSRAPDDDPTLIERISIQ